MKPHAIATAIVAIVAAACSSSTKTTTAGSSTTAAGRTVTIAVGGPFSGTDKSTGDQIVAGAKLATDQVNAAGGITAGPLKGARIVMDTSFDDGDVPQRAKDNIDKVIDDKRYLAFVGSGLSDASVVAAADASQANLPYLAAYASAPKILDAATAAKSVFVVPPTFPAYSFSITDQMLKAGYKKPGILSATGTYGQGIAGYVVDRLKAANLTPVATETFKFGDPDFSTQLGRIKAANADSLVMVGLAADDALIVKQATGQVGLKVPVFDPGGITYTDTFINDAGPAANGVTGNTPTDAGRNTPAAKNLRAAYTAATRENVLPDPAAFAYEGVQAVAAGLADGATGRDDLATHIHQIDIPDTGIGPLKFAADGSRVGGRLWIFKVTNGAPVFTTGYEQTGPLSVKEIPLER